MSSSAGRPDAMALEDWQQPIAPQVGRYGRVPDDRPRSKLKILGADHRILGASTPFIPLCLLARSPAGWSAAASWPP